MSTTTSTSSSPSATASNRGAACNSASGRPKPCASISCKATPCTKKRLQERGIEIGQALALLQQTLANQSLINAEGAAVLAVVQDYAKSWSLLQGYDEQNLVAVTARQHDMRPLAFEDVLAALAELKTALIAKGEATELFGQLRGDGLASAIATIEQGFGDSYFYPNIASRAAHLLYFVIKNHPLADGNKRSGAFLSSGTCA